MTEWWNQLEGGKRQSVVETWVSNPGATSSPIDQLAQKFGSRLPDQYIEWMRQSDGARISHYHLWPIDVVLEDGYGAHEFGPHLVFFGTNGCGELFAFDERGLPGEVSMVHSVSNWKTDVVVIAVSFPHFLARVERAANTQSYSLLTRDW